MFMQSNEVYNPKLTLRSAISHASNCIRNELITINAYQIPELRSNRDYAAAFGAHVASLAAQAQRLLDIVRELETLHNEGR